MKIKITTLVAFILLGIGCAGHQSSAAAPWVEVPTQPGGRYLIFNPYNQETGKPIKICLALHGRGGEATSYGRLWHEALHGEYLVIAPQAPRKNRAGSSISTWQTQADRKYLDQIWQDIQANGNIDEKASVIIGYSAGAWPAFDMATRHKVQIGGLVLHGAGPSGSLENLKGLSVFLLTGSRDGGLGPQQATKVFNQLKKLQINAEMYIAPNTDHAQVYAKVREAADWILRGFTPKPINIP